MENKNNKIVEETNIVEDTKKEAIVVANALNLRSGKSLDASIIKVLEKDEKLVLKTGKIGKEWTSVVTSNNEDGFVMTEFIKVV